MSRRNRPIDGSNANLSRISIAPAPAANPDTPVSEPPTHSTPERAAADQTTSIEPVRSPRVFATVCPVNPNHVRTRVYSKQGRTRYCICDDCGATWKQIADDPPTAIPPHRRIDS